MANVEKGFVSLTYAEQNGSERVQFQFELPEYVDRDRIGVNLRSVDTACRIGGISELGLHGVSGMDTSSEEVDVVGVSPKGEALAGKTRVKEAEMSEAEFVTGPFPLPPSMRSTQAHVHLNLDEMSSRISNKGEKSGGIRSAKEWSGEIDKASREVVDTLGQMQLLALMSNWDKLFPLSMDAHAVLVSAEASPLAIPFGDFNPQQPDLIQAGSNILLINLFLNSADLIMFRKVRRYGRLRLSLFNGPQYDRAIILKAYTKLKTFVKEIKA